MPGCLEYTGVVTPLIMEARESRGDLMVIWLDLTNAGFPVAQLVEHGVSNAKIMGSIPRESKS